MKVEHFPSEGLDAISQAALTFFIVFEQLRYKLERSAFNLWGYNNYPATVITQWQLT